MDFVLLLYVVVILVKVQKNPNVDFVPDEAINKSAKDLLSMTVTDKRDIEPI